MTIEAKTRKCELVAEAVRITLEENNALAKGNTEAMMLANMEAMMLANMEAFDYGFVAKKDLKMAKKTLKWRKSGSTPQRFARTQKIQRASPPIIIGLFGTMPHLLPTRETL